MFHIKEYRLPFLSVRPGQTEREAWADYPNPLSGLKKEVEQ
jgi:hypothetical protein